MQSIPYGVCTKRKTQAFAKLATAVFLCLSSICTSVMADNRDPLSNEGVPFDESAADNTPPPTKDQDGWHYLYDDIYIDLKSKKETFSKVSVRVMINYKSISSAQMFGLSEVENVAFDCLTTKYRNLGEVWYDKQMAQGRINKTFHFSQKDFSIPVYYIKLFSKLCAPLR